MKNKNDISENEIAINVHLDLRSYKEHSDKIKEICESYEGLMDENKRLRERIASLK